MAISRATLLKELLPGLNELFGTEYERGWAVHADYYYDDQTWRILKVEPWNPLKHDVTKGIMHIKEAQDEMDAYTQAKKALEGRYK